MKKLTQKILLCFLCIFLLALSTRSVRADENSSANTIMYPDKETRLQWIQDYETAPRAYIDESKKFLAYLGASASLSLLSHLEYTPSERDQGTCGDCWAWAGTGVMEIALNIQNSVKDRLSIQYLNSCDTSSRYACCGGWLSRLADYYTDVDHAIPWSNTNASWQDGTKGCVDASSDVLCSSIPTYPRYPIASIEAQVIETHSVSDEQAIANIKNVLNQNKAVWFGFFMANEDWNIFRNFWSNDAESTLWDFDITCNKESNGGHAVLCVGYDNTDPDNAYWIMLNSWGTTDGRPTGLFRVDMNMDYTCIDTEDYYNLYWQTLDVDFGTQPGVTTGSATSVTNSSATLNGTVNPNLESTTYYFEYGTTINYGSTTTPASAGSGADNLPVSSDIEGLTANTTYHFRLVSTNSVGTTIGNDKTFNASISTGGSSGCFIATAAYGSPMHEHIGILTKFRDRYLLVTTTGREFVDFYYKNSPTISDFIARNNLLKGLVLSSLLPVVGFCYTSLHFGITNAAIIFFLVLVLPIIFFRTKGKTKAKNSKPIPRR